MSASSGWLQLTSRWWEDSEDWAFAQSKSSLLTDHHSNPCHECLHLNQHLVNVGEWINLSLALGEHREGKQASKYPTPGFWPKLISDFLPP